MTPKEISEKVVDEWFGYQDKFEMEMALTVVGKLQPKVILEIGTAHGASLAAWAEIAKPDLTIALDPEDIPRTTEQQKSFDFLAKEYNFRRIPFYTRNPVAHSKLKAILDKKKVDFMFIDAAHDFDNVLYDFYAYKKYMAPNGVVGFHDITYNEVLADAGSTVSFFWDRMVTRYNYDIFYHHSTMGIGFIYLGMPVTPSTHKT